MWKILVVFVLCGYAISTVLAFDGSKKPAEVEKPQITTTSPSLHTQIESNVAFGVKKVWKNLVEFMQDGLTTKTPETPVQSPVSEPSGTT